MVSIVAATLNLFCQFQKSMDFDCEGDSKKMIVMKNGKRLQGMILVRDKNITSIKGFGGATVTVDSNQVAKVSDLKKSLMISASNLGLKAQELRDVVEYLQRGE